jgi:hypothetical protein
VIAFGGIRKRIELLARLLLRSESQCDRRFPSILMRVLFALPCVGNAVIVREDAIRTFDSDSWRC